MARLPELSREDLSADDQPVWDEIIGSRGHVIGPFTVLMQQPRLAQHVARLGEYLRFHSGLPGAERELAILAAGRELGAAFEWCAHEPIARREGTRAAAIAAVLGGGSPEELTTRERLIIEVVRAMYRDHALPNDLYQRAAAEFGVPLLVELVTLAGYYGMIGFVLLAFQVDLLPDMQPPF